MVRVKHFLSIFAKNEQSNLVLVLVLVLESKGPYYHYLIHFLLHPLCNQSPMNYLRQLCFCDASLSPSFSDCPQPQFTFVAWWVGIPMAHKKEKEGGVCFPPLPLTFLWYNIVWCSIRIAHKLQHFHEPYMYLESYVVINLTTSCFVV